MKITYTAWLKDEVGIDEEVVTLPADVTNVHMLLDWLSRRGLQHERAFEFIEVVKVAVNQVYAAGDHSVKDDDEIILFPPIAGG